MVDRNDIEVARINLILGRLKADIVRPFLQEVGARLVNGFKLGFRKSTAPDGTPWAPVARKGGKGKDGKPLVDTGRLRRSITHEVTGKQLEVGTNVIYGPTHQFGDKSPVTIPTHTRLINKVFGKKLKFGVHATIPAHQRNRDITARPFLGIEAKQRRQITRAYNDFMKTITGGEATGS